MFAMPVIEEIDYTEYNNASTGDYTKKVTLYQGTYTAPTTTGFAEINSNEQLINDRPVSPVSWSTFSGNQSALTGSENVPFDESKTVHGLVNRNFISNYNSNVAGLSGSLTDWGSICDIPLMIYNKEATSFGYASTNKTFGANTYNKVTIRVKTVGNATAFIYLVDGNVENAIANGNNYKVLDFTVPAHKDANGTDVAEQKVALQTSVSNTSAYVANSLEFAYADGWVEIKFYVLTGDEAVNYRVELWNGSRDGQTASQGYVFFDALNVGTMEEATYNLYAEKYDEMFTDSAKYTFRYNDKDTEKAVDSIAFLNKDYTTFLSYKGISVIEDTEEKKEETTDKKSGCADISTASIFTFASSILLVLVLIGVGIVLLVKRQRKSGKSIFGIFKKKKSKVKSSYNENEYDEYLKEKEIEKAKNEKKQKKVDKFKKKMAKEKAREEKKEAKKQAKEIKEEVEENSTDDNE